MYKLIIKDESGTATATWFNQSYLKNVFRVGEKYKFYGKISNHFGKITINSPVYESSKKNSNTGKIIPIYPLTYKLTQNTIRKIIENGLLEIDGNLKESLPEYLINEYNLLRINEAIKTIHFPKDFNDFSLARRRLVFEELLSTQLALLKIN